MTEQELRALVREAISRHLDRSEHGHGAAAPPRQRQQAAQGACFALFSLPDGSSSDGPCIIEPAVPCSHCGYCKSYGH